MARRVYYKTLKREKLQSEALNSMRAARQEIDPALLDYAREAIATAIEAHQESMEGADTIAVDRQKNLEIIQRYIEMTPQSKNAHRQIKSILQS